MEKLFRKSDKILRNVSLDFKRYLHTGIDDTEKLIGLTGARGVGKTTILLHKLKEKNIPSSVGFYASMDDIYFSTNTLVDLADEFVNIGGKYIFLDEVHKYETWSIELKNIYDTYPELHVMFTGSSVLEMSKTKGDLSRRAMIYMLETMSFREYLEYEEKIKIPALSLKELVSDHIEIANSLLETGFLPFKYFESFLKNGSYPFSFENKSNFYEKLKNTINLIIENDLMIVAGIDYSTGIKIKKLLVAISECVPFKPNLSELSAKVGVDRKHIYDFISYLERSRLINTLISDEKGLNMLVKPEMIYLENTSLAYALCGDKPETGIKRNFLLQSTEG